MDFRDVETTETDNWDEVEMAVSWLLRIADLWWLVENWSLKDTQAKAKAKKKKKERLLMKS